MIVYGKNVIKEAIYANRPIYEVWIDQKMHDRSLLSLLENKQISYQVVAKEVLNEKTGNALHQGIVANVKPYEYKALEDVLNKDKIQRFIILDGIEDPQNLGAILRTAEAVTLDGIIMSKKQQVPLNATVAKVSSGGIEHVNVILVSNINLAISKLKESNVLVVGTDGGAALNYDSIPKEASTAIVLGNEGSGMRHLVKTNCDLLVKIPMYGKVNSLNVSVAAALLMYQMVS